LATAAVIKMSIVIIYFMTLAVLPLAAIGQSLHVRQALLVRQTASCFCASTRRAGCQVGTAPAGCPRPGTGWLQSVDRGRFPGCPPRHTVLLPPAGAFRATT